MLNKEDFIKRLTANRKDKETYLYQVDNLKTPNESYVEWARDYIVENAIEKVNEEWRLKEVPAIRRDKSYHWKHSVSDTPNSNRGEELFVRGLFGKGGDPDAKDKFYAAEKFDKLVDYQVPLKGKLTDKGAGKIDFIYVKDGKVYLAEIKKEGSPESALRAILEIQTYYQMVNKRQLLDNFDLKDMKVSDVKKAVVLFKNTPGANQVENNIYIKELIDLFDIKVVLL